MKRSGIGVITIDGPVASGKSTLSRILAHKLHCYYLNSGLLYRALSYLLITARGYTVNNLDGVSQKDIDYCLGAARFSYQYDGHDVAHQERIFFENIDITSHLKDRTIDKIASIISVRLDVRHAITALQHCIADNHSIVTDGRDVGSIVFPHAECKFYVTASIQVRAARWRKDQEKYGNYVSQHDAVAAITDRDERDKNRAIAPLIVPEGAIIIDTSDLNVEQTIEKMLECISNDAKLVL
jgi:cytidylate kinase